MSEISKRFGIGESSVYRVAQRHGASLRVGRRPEAAGGGADSRRHGHRPARPTSGQPVAPRATPRQVARAPDDVDDAQAAAPPAPAQPAPPHPPTDDADAEPPPPRSRRRGRSLDRHGPRPARRSSHRRRHAPPAHDVVGDRDRQPARRREPRRATPGRTQLARQLHGDARVQRRLHGRRHSPGGSRRRHRDRRYHPQRLVATSLSDKGKGHGFGSSPLCVCTRDSRA